MWKISIKPQYGEMEAKNKKFSTSFLLAVNEKLKMSILILLITIYGNFTCYDTLCEHPVGYPRTKLEFLLAFNFLNRYFRVMSLDFL